MESQISGKFLKSVVVALYASQAHVKHFSHERSAGSCCALCFSSSHQYMQNSTRCSALAADVWKLWSVSRLSTAFRFEVYVFICISLCIHLWHLEELLDSVSGGVLTSLPQAHWRD